MNEYYVNLNVKIDMCLQYMKTKAKHLNLYKALKITHINTRMR